MYEMVRGYFPTWWGESENFILKVDWKLYRNSAELKPSRQHEWHSRTFGHLGDVIFATVPSLEVLESAFNPYYLHVSRVSLWYHVFQCIKTWTVSMVNVLSRRLVGNIVLFQKYQMVDGTWMPVLWKMITGNTSGLWQNEITRMVEPIP